MQCACAVLSSVACLALQYFSTFSHKRRDFKNKKVLNIQCVLIFSTAFITNDMIKMYIGLHVIYTLKGRTKYNWVYHKTKIKLVRPC